LSATVSRTVVRRSASDIRIVLGQLNRRLRAEHRLPLSHGIILARLEREGPTIASGLAAAERVRPQSIAQTIFDLESDGFVTRARDRVDRRRWVITITDAGRAALAEDRSRREGWLAQAIETELTPDEQDVLVRSVQLLRRLAES
jgi:DNA-binding MarR family transcriptional regulator